MEDRAVAVERAHPGEDHAPADGRIQGGQQVLRRVWQLSAERSKKRPHGIRNPLFSAGEFEDQADTTMEAEGMKSSKARRGSLRLIGFPTGDLRRNSDS